MKKMVNKAAIIYSFIVLIIAIYGGRITDLSGLPHTVLAGGGVLLLLAVVHPTEQGTLISRIALLIIGILLVFIDLYEKQRITLPTVLLAVVPIAVIIVLQIREKDTQ